ncbi:MAG: glycoside hydrolase family 15, partial [Propionibacteriaceae bacterium]
DRPGSLPPASPDYWEVRERRTTLATTAVLLAGLEAGGRLPGRSIAARAAAVERSTS